jgi:hypothetical protein
MTVFASWCTLATLVGLVVLHSFRKADNDADAMCNYIGNERWVNELETNFKEEFQASSPLPWVTIKGDKVAGEVRFAGGEGASAGNVTFVTIYESGVRLVFQVSESFLNVTPDSIWCPTTLLRRPWYVAGWALMISLDANIAAGHVHSVDPGCLPDSVITIPDCYSCIISAVCDTSFLSMRVCRHSCP